MQRCKLDRRHFTCARETANLIGCHYRKVDKIRKIRRDGWPEIQDGVSNDELTINKAYKMIRDAELGTETSENKLSAGQIKVLRSVLSERNFEGLHTMGGELGSLINLAVERFICGLRDKQRSEIPGVGER